MWNPITGFFPLETALYSIPIVIVIWLIVAALGD
jgi:hypothetical protein